MPSHGNMSSNGGLSERKQGIKKARKIMNLKSMNFIGGKEFGNILI